MTQKNNENTKFLLVDDSSSNYLPLMIVGAGLAYTFYHKYTKHCSLDGKTAIFSSQWIESIDPNVPGKINLDVKINKTAEKNIFTLSPNGLDETWGTFNFQGQEQGIIIGKDGINTAEIVRAPNGNLSATFLFNTVSFVAHPSIPPVTINLPTLTYTLYPNKFNKNNFDGFTTSGSDLTLPPPFPPIKYLIAGKGQLKINH